MERNIEWLPLLFNLTFVVGAAIAAGGGWKAWAAALIGAALLCFIARHQLPSRRCGATAETEADTESALPLKAPFWF